MENANYLLSQISKYQDQGIREMIIRIRNQITHGIDLREYMLNKLYEIAEDQTSKFYEYATQN